MNENDYFNLLIDDCVRALANVSTSLIKLKFRFAELSPNTFVSEAVDRILDGFNNFPPMRNCNEVLQLNSNEKKVANSISIHFCIYLLDLS